jgi:hypothetical protein
LRLKLPFADGPDKALLPLRGFLQRQVSSQPYLHRVTIYLDLESQAVQAFKKGGIVRQYG